MIADPFSLLLGGSNSNSMTPAALFQATPKEEVNSLFADTGMKKAEESGNGGEVGGWGDDDDDIDIE